MGYANGRYAWSTGDWSRFPHAAHVTIDVNGTNPSADVLDIENGDASVGQAPAWTKQHNKIHPTVERIAVLYCNRSTLTPLFNAMAANGLHIGHDFKLGIATLDGTTEIADMTGVAFVQDKGEAQTGGHYDESIVYDDTWMAASTTPKPPPVVLRTKPPGPPGDYLEGTFVGRSTNDKLYRTDYDATTGQWSPYVEEAGP